MMRTLAVVLSVLLALVSCQRRGNPFKVFQNGAKRPKCSDNSRPTCVCPDGTVVDRYRARLAEIINNPLVILFQ